jgi:ribosomal protein S18 acetylase RimI-like enzyme
VWGRILPGKTALVRAPWLAADEDAETAQRLLGSLDEYLQEGDVHLAQALLSTEAAEDAARLRDAGYVYGADLLFMVCLQERFPIRRPRGVLDFEPYHDRDYCRMAELVQSTYGDTRDLPLLNGARDMDDILHGYQQTGVFEGDRWLFVRRQRRDVGCLLLADHPEEDQWELVYMGITPPSRGRGWGLQIARHGLWLAGRSGRKRVVLAVDALNEPAVSVYEAAGFVTWDRRSVYLRFFRSGSA